MVASIVIWALGYYPNHDEYESVTEPQENSYIGRIGKAMEPVILSLIHIYVFHQDGLTGFGLCHNQGTLARTDGGKQVYDTGRHRVGVSTFAKLELLVREEGGEVLALIHI